MAEKQKTKSVYRKIITETTQGGDLKRQTTIDLSPWKFEAEGDNPERSGHTCQIRVSKFGEKPKMTIVNFDPFNKDIREAIKQMYLESDKLPRK